MIAPQNLAVGIDLGTSNSCVAVVLDGAPQMLADPGGHKLHGSVVNIQPDGNVLVGNPAKNLLTSQPERTAPRLDSVAEIIKRLG